MSMCGDTNHSSCGELIDKLYLLLDDELNVKEEKILIEHLDMCGECLELFNIEKRYLQFIKERCEKKVVSKDLVTSIKFAITSQIQREI